jgi:hypothetical protein
MSTSRLARNENCLDNSRQLEYRGAGVDVKLEVYSEMLHVFDFRAAYAPEADDAVHALAGPVPNGPAAR